MNKLIIGLIYFSTMLYPGVEIHSGKASFYGMGNWHGSITANGETFKPLGYTCAHRTLSFDTMLLVINLDNGKKAICRVNDRGPFDIAEGKPIVDLQSNYERKIDVSVGVARQLDMIDQGISNVQFKILN